MPPPRQKLLRATLAAGVALLCSGCFSYHYRNPELPAGPQHEEWLSYFLFGIVGHHDIDIREVCPGGEVNHIELGTNGATWLVSSLTLGIYTPRKIYVTCADIPAATEAAPEAVAPVEEAQ